MIKIKTNILVLSVGRRVELVELFKEAVKELSPSGKVIGADASKTAPALYFCDDKEIIPRINHENYIDTIINISIKHDIDLIVPTIDTELLILSENKKKIEERTKAKVLVSDLEVIKICRDKIKTQNYIESKGFKMPKRFEKHEIKEMNNFPIFIKPISGSSSINAFKVNSFNEYKAYLEIIDNPLIQECIEGEEYTVDVFTDFNSNIITIVPRLRIETRGGEISKGKIIKDKEVIDEVRKLITELKPIGHITVQLFKNLNGIYFIEINPRFGGGAPMSIKSGANSCKNLIKLLNGERLEYNESYEENKIHLRFDSSIII